MLFTRHIHETICLNGYNIIHSVIYSCATENNIYSRRIRGNITWCHSNHMCTVLYFWNRLHF